MSTVDRDTGTPTATFAYTFDNARETAPRLLRGITEMHDQFSISRLTALAWPGQRWLEIGAGSGSIAEWLLKQVTSRGGEVVATDIRTQHIPQRPGLTILQHDITKDPLPDGRFHGIHIRAVLKHLPGRYDLLPSLVAALHPGGVLVVEEMAPAWATAVVDTPDERAYTVFEHYGQALAKVLTSAGNEATWDRRVFRAMREAGLGEVDQQCWYKTWHGGTGAGLIALAGSTEKRDSLIAAGMPADELDLLAELAMDPRLVLRGIPLVSTVGRKTA
jgi:2-polyprenyl-3-methyl-5-hydroxy-6-metoxy-1,4-benzoquinol methylase